MRLGLLPAVALAAAAHAQAPVDFTRDVEPLLAKRCQGCHGPAQQMNGLRLDQAEAALKGGYSGPAILPGKSGDSKLIQRVSSVKPEVRMPPAGPALSAAEVAVLRRWIDDGAKWGLAGASPLAAGTPSPTHWAFLTVRRPAPPDVQNRAWVRNPIDAFVLSRLERERLEPSPEAAKTTLVRRVSLDLTGLPPAPDEIASFLADNRPDAYERVVDRLLASPHYGEKWARQWLDLARYADSDGYEKDQSRPWAWRWRQWVIEALNADMPFDRFTIEQLAGDLLPNPTVGQLVATGFHRNTLTNREAGVDRAEARFEQLVNRTNTTGTVWLGLTAGCAQCHNHKYDPITQKDYYSLLAVFERSDEREIDAPLPGELGAYLAARPEYDRKRVALLEEYREAESQNAWETKMRAAIAEPGRDLEWDFNVTQMKAMVDGTVRILTAGPGKRSRRDAARITAYFLANPGPDIGRDKPRAAEIRELREKLSKLDATLPAITQAAVMYEDPAAPKTRIRLKGDYRALGVEVEPGVPSFLPGAAEPHRDRLELARWLVSRDNPLTARVAVNRMWQEFFGRGLVATSEDFGTQGDKPSHPGLLDWLASEFVDGGWSIKRMHRLIVTSAVYRQSSRTRPEIEERDPANSLLARQARVRLSAELIRDAALAASGLLNTAVGGRSVKPPQPAGVAELAYANSVKWVESKGPDRYRRGLYVHYQRTAPHPQLVIFDEPDSNVSCSRRRVSNTPLQALNLLNDPVFFEAAQGLSVRVLGEPAGTTGERLDSAFVLALGRKPSAGERERLSKYHDGLVRTLDAGTASSLLPVRLETAEPAEGAAWTAIARVLLNLDEFITRE